MQLTALLVTLILNSRTKRGKRSTHIRRWCLNLRTSLTLEGSIYTKKDFVLIRSTLNTYDEIRYKRKGLCTLLLRGGRKELKSEGHLCNTIRGWITTGSSRPLWRLPLAITTEVSEICIAFQDRRPRLILQQFYKFRSQMIRSFVSFDVLLRLLQSHYFTRVKGNKLYTKTVIYHTKVRRSCLVKC